MSTPNIRIPAQQSMQAQAEFTGEIVRQRNDALDNLARVSVERNALPMARESAFQALEEFLNGKDTADTAEITQRVPGLSMWLAMRQRPSRPEAATAQTQES